jgi:hypothetical protein
VRQVIRRACAGAHASGANDAGRLDDLQAAPRGLRRDEASGARVTRAVRLLDKPAARRVRYAPNSHRPACSFFSP